MNSRNLIYALAAVPVLALLAWAGYGALGGAGDGALLRPDNARLVARGAAVYAAQCATCHGANLQGQADWQTPDADGQMPAPPHDDTGHTWHHPDDMLFNITKVGIVRAAGLTNYTSGMPIYEDILSDEEIIAVLSYIKAQWSDDIRRMHDLNTERSLTERKP